MIVNGATIVSHHGPPLSAFHSSSSNRQPPFAVAEANNCKRAFIPPYYPVEQAHVNPDFLEPISISSRYHRSGFDTLQIKCPNRRTLNATIRADQAMDSAPPTSPGGFAPASGFSHKSRTNYNASCHSSHHCSTPSIHCWQTVSKGSILSHRSSEVGSYIGTDVESSSSWEYRQESFEKYQHKVVKLCYDLGYGAPAEIELLNGGSFNRVIGLFFPTSAIRGRVLRIPRFSMDEEEAVRISDQVSVLHYLMRFEFLHVPKVLAFQATRENAIHSQYVLQERLRGKPIQDFFYTLPLSEKLVIAGLVAQMMIKIDLLTFDRPGRLIGRRPTSPELNHTLVPASDIVIAGFRATPVQDMPAMKQQSLASFIISLLEFRKHENSDWEQMVERCGRLQEFAKQMEKVGLMRITDDVNVIWHWNLSASSVLMDYEIAKEPGSCLELAHKLRIVQIESQCKRAAERKNGSWVITGILGWDDVKSVPRVLARTPPSWLWRNENTQGGGWSGNRDTPRDQDLMSDELLIKAHFDQIMQRASPGYIDDAYHRGPWLRKLAQFGLEGFEDGADWNRFEGFIEDWTEYYDSLSK